MTVAELRSELEELRRLPRETEWVEFKHNNCNFEEIGEYIAAISNSAALHGKRAGYIIWGVEDGTHAVVGTSFRPKTEKKGNEELENWLLRQLEPRIDFSIHEFEASGKPIVLFAIQAANSRPVQFRGVRFIRVGSYKKKLKEYAEKERTLWQLLSEPKSDWSARIVSDATVADLDRAALDFARAQYRLKNPRNAAAIDSWDDVTFLNKAKLLIGGNVTNAALVLLGKREATALVAPAQARITWILRDEKSTERDYSHFDPPFILASDGLLEKIRNLTIRHLPSGTLFPHEVSQYDPWVIRETLHNCIAHQDYGLGAKITVVETPASLLFTNAGSFIPGTVEDMIRSDAPPAIYRNPFLAQAMVSVNMIDTIGSGIKRMFRLQKERSFPMPDYDLSSGDRVAVGLAGQVLDENYTQLLLRATDLELLDVIALDRVQKKLPLDSEAFGRLKARNLIEGRRPNIYVSAGVAAVTAERAAYIKNRAFDRAHYKEMVIRYLRQFGEAARMDLDSLLIDKLSNAMNAKQKKAFVTNLLQEMKTEGQIEPDGVTRWAKWRLPRKGAGGAS